MPPLYVCNLTSLEQSRTGAKRYEGYKSESDTEPAFK